MVDVFTLRTGLPAISDRQFGEGLWRDDLISYDDYLAFVGPGAIPPRLLAIVEQLPDDGTGTPTPQKVARGLLTGAKDFEFANPFVEQIRQAFERDDARWTPEFLRDRWTFWATL